ncbi:MAG: hypothetical protein V4692_16865, partial [Bdellovibrionota bacterium]
MIRTDDPIDQLFRQHRTVSDAFNASGLALVSKGMLKDFAGLTPLKSDIEALGTWVFKRLVDEGKSVVALDSIASIDSKWEPIKVYVSGVIAVRLPDVDDSILMFFRPEIIQKIAWGGDPRKHLEKRKFQGQIHPRQ